MNPRQIADHLNALGITSKTGKAFYPALVYSVISKMGLGIESRQFDTAKF
jgi:hypothetical protein